MLHDQTANYLIM